jgi:hypothetical protein
VRSCQNAYFSFSALVKILTLCKLQEDEGQSKSKAEVLETEKPFSMRKAARMAALPGWRRSQGGGDPRMEALPGWRRSKDGGAPRMEALPGWRRSQDGGAAPYLPSVFAVGIPP